MSKAVFPTENEIGLVFGKSPRILLERHLVTWQRYRSACALETFVYQGFALSAGAGLSVNVASGDAIINGYWASNDATENHAALAASRSITTPNFIFAQLTRSGVDSRLVLPGYVLVSNTTGTAPADSVLLGIAATDATSVIQVIDSRKAPTIVSGTYTGQGGNDPADQYIFLGFQWKRVTVWGRWRQGTPSNLDAEAISIPAGGTLGWNSAVGQTADDEDIPLTAYAGYGFVVHEDVEAGGVQFGLNKLQVGVPDYHYQAEA